MKVSSTKSHATNRLKFLVYGQPGVGKTTLASTIGEPTLVISAEAGLLSLQDFDIDTIDISVDEDGKPVAKEYRMSRLFEVFNWLASHPEPKEKYSWLFIDSLTELSQNMIEGLQQIYTEKSDTLKLWGDYAIKSRAMVKRFRDLPYYNVGFTALDLEEKDDSGKRFVRVDMQGKTGKQLPAFFDEVFHLFVDHDNGRRLLTSAHEGVVAKDRSGKLSEYEPAHLGKIIEKIRGGNKK